MGGCSALRWWHCSGCVGGTHRSSCIPPTLHSCTFCSAQSICSIPAWYFKPPPVPATALPVTRAENARARNHPYETRVTHFSERQAPVNCVNTKIICLQSCLLSATTNRALLLLLYLKERKRRVGEIWGWVRSTVFSPRNESKKGGRIGLRAWELYQDVRPAPRAWVM